MPGCRDDEPPPEFNYNLGTDDQPLLPTPITFQNPEILQGRATLVPLAEPEPDEPPPDATSDDATGGDADSAAPADDQDSDDEATGGDDDTTAGDVDDATGD